MFVKKSNEIILCSYDNIILRFCACLACFEADLCLTFFQIIMTKPKNLGFFNFDIVSRLPLSKKDIR